MIKKYETFYDRFKKREHVKQMREKEKSKNKQAIIMHSTQVQKTSFHYYNQEIQNNTIECGKKEHKVKEKQSLREIHHISHVETVRHVGTIINVESMQY